MRRAKTKEVGKAVFRVELGAGFVLLFALVFFFDESSFIAALAPAVAAHELGHVLFMLFFGARPTRLRAALTGFEIDYSGYLTETQEMLTALAGPAFGLMFAVLCARLGAAWNSEYLLMSAGLGFLLSIFNFLPADPLDGGRVFGFFLRRFSDFDRAEKSLRASGLCVSALLTVSGLYLISRGLGPALFLAGLWLFILQRKKSCQLQRRGIQ